MFNHFRDKSLADDTSSQTARMLQREDTSQVKSKSDSKKKKYWRKRERHRPPMYERDYYDEYFYDYPPPYSSSWYRHRRTIPRIRPRFGYSMESSNSEHRYTPLEPSKDERDRMNDK